MKKLLQWVVECENAEDYMIETSNNDRCLEITALKYHDGAIIKVSLIDEEQKYISDSIELEAMSLG